MIQWITSTDDPRLDAYHHVGDPLWLRQQDLFVAEGRLVVDRLFDLDAFDIVSILVNRAAHDALLGRLAAAHAEVYVCDDPSLTTITGFNFHRGCLALVRRPAPAPREMLMGGSLLLGLEGVGNPDNVGGLFRSAAAFNADGILLNPTSGDPLYRKAVRTSMGAVLRVPFVRLADWPMALDAFRDDGFTLVALTPESNATPIAEFAEELPADARLILLLGAEGSGLNETTLTRAHARVRIPIDSAVDSLNVTVAGAIALSYIRVRFR